MKRTKWPPERTAQLLGLVDQGLDRREIAAHMGVGIRAVTAKFVRLKCVVPLSREERCNQIGHATADRFPMFENITPAEAAAIRKGMPPSAPFAEGYNRSLIGNAARLCVE